MYQAVFEHAKNHKVLTVRTYGLTECHVGEEVPLAGLEPASRSDRF